MKQKTFVEDVNRNLYDFKYDEKDYFKVDEGLTPEIVELISKEKNDPEWMREFRLKSLEVFNELRMPDWGPSIEGLDMDNIVTYVRPKGGTAAGMSFPCIWPPWARTGMRFPKR